MLTKLLQTIDSLREGIAIEPTHQRSMTIGVPSIDDAIGGGLACGLHEWFGIAGAHANFKGRSLPIEIPVYLARRVRQTRDTAPWVIWIGRRCFPYPHLLADERDQDQSLFNHAVFVDAETPSDRLWSIEQAMDSPVIGVVVADGSRFNMAATRRIQLRAQTHGTFVFVGRPLAELSELSAAQTRWLIRYERSHACGRALFVNPRWRVKLLRCKGMRSLAEGNGWVLERDRATRVLRLSAEVAHSAIDDQTARQSA